MSSPEAAARREALLARLRELEEQSPGDPEAAHLEADHALLAYIDDAEISAVFDEIQKWYA